MTKTLLTVAATLLAVGFVEAAIYSTSVDGTKRTIQQLPADVESVTFDIPGHGKTTVFREGTRIHIVALGDQTGGRKVVVRFVAGNYVTVGHEK